MTDYANMDAGREMDALVAEKVMGWRLCEGIWVGQGYQSRLLHRWRPSGKIVHATIVLDKLHKDGWDSTLIFEKDHSKGECWCQLVRRGQAYESKSVFAPARALAICRAALMTTQGKEANDEMAKDDMRRR